nr:restriction endonuclease subunit S [Kistimonas asteriae]
MWASAYTQKSSVGRGSNNKLNLHGIKQLRALILDLAVRGKLVPQDSNDEPASVLLEKVAIEKVRLIDEGKIKKQKALPAITDDEQPFILPAGWVLVRFEDIVDIQSGITKGRKLVGRELESIPYLRVANVQRGSLDLTEIKEVEIPVEEKEKYKVKPRDLLITEGGDWDKVGRTAIWSGELPYIAHQNHVFKARLFLDEQSEQWLEMYLNGPIAREYFAGSSKQTTNLASINKTQLRSCVIAIPPVEEKNRIVAKVQELMMLCDQLEQQQADSITAHETLVDTLLASLANSKTVTETTDNWSRIADHFDTLFTTEHSINKLKQTIIQLAVTGKLVPQSSTDESADVLLKSIFAEQSRLFHDEKLKTKAALSISDEEKYLSVPDSWAFIRLGNIAKFIDYRGKTPTKQADGIRLITAKNVRFGYISLQPAEFISETEYDSWMTRGFPRVGDLLFTPEAPLGNVAIIDIDEKFALAQRAICFQLHEKQCAEFLKLMIMSPVFQQQLQHNATGITAKGIKAARLKEIPVPQPPMEEQHRIVSKVKDLMLLCDQLVLSIRQSQQTNMHLADAIVEQALA